MYGVLSFALLHCTSISFCTVCGLQVCTLHRYNCHQSAAVFYSVETAGDMFEEIMSEENAEYKLPGLGTVKVSQSPSAGISTTMTPIRMKRRKKKVKLIKRKKNDTINTTDGEEEDVFTQKMKFRPDNLLHIPSLGQVSVPEPPTNINDIEAAVEKEIDEIDIDNAHEESLKTSSKKFHFILPNLGEVILTNQEQQEDFMKKKEESNKEENKLLLKKHSLSHIAGNSKYPYFTKFPPFNKSFYKPQNLQRHTSKDHKRRNDQRPTKRKPINILSNIVTNSLSLFKQGPRWSKPISMFQGTQTKKLQSPGAITITKFKNDENVDEKFDIKRIPFHSNHPHHPHSNILTGQMSQEFLLAHLVLVSIPLLFTGIRSMR